MRESSAAPGQLAHGRERMRPCRARRAVDGHQAGQRGRARQEDNQVIGDGSAAMVARLGQALSRWAKPRRGQTADALRCMVTAATG